MEQVIETILLSLMATFCNYFIANGFECLVLVLAFFEIFVVVVVLLFIFHFVKEN